MEELRKGRPREGVRKEVAAKECPTISRGTRPTNEVAKGGPDKMSEEKSSAEALRGRPQERSREEVVSGGPP